MQRNARLWKVNSPTCGEGDTLEATTERNTNNTTVDGLQVEAIKKSTVCGCAPEGKESLESGRFVDGNGMMLRNAEITAKVEVTGKAGTLT